MQHWQIRRAAMPNILRICGIYSNRKPADNGIAWRKGISVHTDNEEAYGGCVRALLPQQICLESAMDLPFVCN